MAALNRSPLQLLRCVGSLRSVFVWLLLVLLLTGAASTRTAADTPLFPATARSSSRHPGLKIAPPQAETEAGPAGSAVPAVRAVQHAGPSIEPEELEKDCCERRLAPRGEPVPVRNGVVDPPTVALRATR